MQFQFMANVGLQWLPSILETTPSKGDLSRGAPAVALEDLAAFLSKAWNANLTISIVSDPDWGNLVFLSEILSLWQ